jgi:type IV pilus assembly protein PilQ
MIKRGITLILLMAAFLVAGCVSSGNVKKQKELGLTIIKGVEINDYSVVLHMKDEPSAAFTVLKPSDPYTVVLEMPDVGMGDVPEKIQSAKLGISELRLATVQTPIQLTRVEILMDAPLDVEPIKVGSSIVINLLGPAKAEKRTEAAREAMVEADLSMPATEITELLLERSNGEVKFTVYSNGMMEPDIFTLTGRIIIDIPGVTMHATPPERVFSPIKGVRVGPYPDKVRLVLDMEEDGDFAASTEDNTVVIIIPTDARYKVMSTSTVQISEDGTVTVVDAPGADAKGLASMGEAPAAEGRDALVPDETTLAEDDEFETKYKGKPISLDFQDSDIIPIFRLIGEIAGYNTVIHPNVRGNITLKLIDVPWDQALAIVLEISGMDSDITGNIMRIAPPEVFIKQKESKQKVQEAVIRTEELVQVAIHLNHISAGEMQTRINEAKLLSPRGTMRIDERANTLILNDTADNIRKIRNEEVKYWDTPQHGTMQVLIEAKIVSVRTDYTHNFGIRWGGNATEQNFTWLNDRTNIDFSVNTPVGAAGPSAVAQGGLMSIGYAETIQVDLSIEALETVKKAKSLANPRVLTIDKQAAKISQGQAIPYAAAAEGGGTTITTTDATLSLDVTPEIRPNGIIMLDVKVTNDSPTVIPGAVAPGIDKQQIQTKALVKDGETLVLGGIFTTSEDESEVRVPVLSKIPIIGWLFKTRSYTKLPNELLIFITPQIIKS